MTATTAPPDARPVLPGPRPRTTPARGLAFLLTVRRNPIELWAEPAFEEPVVAMTNLMGRVTGVHDPAGIRHVQVENAQNYPKDRLQRRVLQPSLGGGLLTAEGETWKRTRRMLAPLFTPRAVAPFAAAMAEAARVSAGRIAAADGGTIDIAAEMQRVTFDVLARTLFSTGFTVPPERFNHAMTHYFEALGRLDPLDAVGAPDWIPRIGRIRAEPSVRFFRETVAGMIAARRALIARDPANAPQDLLSALIAAADPETGAGLTPEEVSANIVTFIGAGHETTANALTWALYLVSLHPDVRASLEAEVAGADPAASPDDLPLTRAVLEEAMRLYPPVTFIGRQAISADRIRNVDVPAGSMVVTSLWVLHRHRRLWETPDAFRPERFLPGARESVDRYAYMPFGAGARICIGAQFALQEAVIVLAEIVRRTRLTFAGAEPPWPVQRVTLRPRGGMTMRVEGR